MGKIKLLMLPSDTMGVGHFRNIWPAQAINRNHQDEIEVEINTTPDFNDLEYFKKFDIVHFHRQLGDINTSPKQIQMLKSLGLTVIMDIDDYWEPFGAHPLYYIIKQEKIGDKIRSLLPLVDHVTTTTSIFRNEILKYNPNVSVLPNSVYPEHKMWSGTDQRSEDNDKVRIAWIGGSSHHADLKLLETSMGILHSSAELKDKYQMVLCGFDTRGNITEVSPDGRQKTRPITPNESVWKRFEEIVTSDYKVNGDNPDYTDYLNRIVKDPYKTANEQNYVRRWTLPLTQYGKHYDYCDVCLAPICDVDQIRTPKGQIINQHNIFNEVKSELKIIEAGIKRKTLIAQDFGIYKELIEDGKNGILIPCKKKHNKEWYKAIKKVILDKDYREELADNLHQFVIEKYNIKKVTEERVDFYKSIMTDKKEIIKA